VKAHVGSPAQPLEELFDVYVRAFTILNRFDRACFRDIDPNVQRSVLFLDSSHHIFNSLWEFVRATRRVRYLTPMIEAAITEYKSRRRKCDGALKKQDDSRYRSIPLPSSDIALLVLKYFPGTPEPSARNTDAARLIRDRHEVGTYFLRVPVMRKRMQEPDVRRDDVGVYFDKDHGLFVVAENQENQLVAAIRFSAERASAKKFAQHFFRIMATLARQVTVEVGNELGGEAAHCRRVFLRYGRLLNTEGVLAVRPVATSHESTSVPTVCPRCGAAAAHTSSDAIRCGSCELPYRRQHVLASWALTEGRSRSGAVWSDGPVPNDAKDSGTAAALATKTPSTSTHTAKAKTDVAAEPEHKGPVKPGRSNDEGLLYAYQPSFKEAVRARAALVDTRSRACFDDVNGRMIREISQVELIHPVIVELDRTSKGLVDPLESADEAEQVQDTSASGSQPWSALEHDSEDGEESEIISIHIPDPNVLRDPFTNEVLRRRPRVKA